MLDLSLVFCWEGRDDLARSVHDDEFSVSCTTVATVDQLAR